MRVLIIHQNFPGQFRHVATAWSQRKGWEVIGIGREGAPGLPGIRMLRYRLSRGPLRQQHPYLRQMEGAVLHGQAVTRLLLDLRRRGFVPDVVLAHPGWGETLYLKDVFPDTRLIHFCEWFYSTLGADVGFDPEFPVSLDDMARVRTWNALHSLNLQNCDIGVTPTHWQWSRHPDAHQSRIQVAHEGIDTSSLEPNQNAWLRQKNGAVLRKGDPVITYVARNLEPYRGFHVFMRALEIIQQRHKTCHAVIVGGDNVSYGRPPKDAPNWRQRMLKEVRLDPVRTHFLGKLPYAAYRTVLQISAVHVYLTYPFVLSWSMLEAMASGCVVIGSRTPPVEEIIQNEQIGLLVDFFDIRHVSEKVIDVLESKFDSDEIRRFARSFAIKNYAQDFGLLKYDQISFG